MNEIVPSKRKFDDALAKIEKASKKNKNVPELKHFEEKGGLFNLFPKIVTGAKMNEFSSELQDNLIILNDKINQFYKQFTDVYSALEALDNEYIAGIVGAFNEAVDAMKAANDAQKDVKKTVDLLNETVEKIKTFNNKVSFELSRIDSENWKENALKHQKELEELDSKAEEISNTIETYKTQHNELTLQLESYKKEKAKSIVNFRICWITTAVSITCTIVVVLLAIFNII